MRTLDHAARGAIIVALLSAWGGGLSWIMRSGTPLALCGGLAYTVLCFALAQFVGDWAFRGWVRLTRRWWRP